MAKDTDLGPNVVKMRVPREGAGNDNGAKKVEDKGADVVSIEAARTNHQVLNAQGASNMNKGVVDAGQFEEGRLLVKEGKWLLEDGDVVGAYEKFLEAEATGVFEAKFWKGYILMLYHERKFIEGLEVAVEGLQPMLLQDLLEELRDALERAYKKGHFQVPDSFIGNNGMTVEHQISHILFMIKEMKGVSLKRKLAGNLLLALREYCPKLAGQDD